MLELKIFLVTHNSCYMHLYSRLWWKVCCCCWRLVQLIRYISSKSCKIYWFDNSQWHTYIIYSIWSHYCLCCLHILPSIFYSHCHSSDMLLLLPAYVHLSATYSTKILIQPTLLAHQLFFLNLNIVVFFFCLVLKVI